jgi:hypothetical protein
LFIQYTIIITAEKKEKYIIETIRSCLEQSLLKKLRIIVVYSKLDNVKEVKSRFLKFKNIIFLKSLPSKKLPIHDQLFKIEVASKYLRNEWVLLLDGDDLFTKKKLENLQKLNLNKNMLYLHDHALVNGSSLSKSKKYKKYKKNFLYKNLFNDWPEKINTSSIVISAKKLKKFYLENNPYKWKFLAIDVQLVLYFHYMNNFIFLNKIFTLKRENINNLDKKYSNCFNKLFWLRRLEQHNLTKKLSGKNNFVDRFITNFFLKFFI